MKIIARAISFFAIVWFLGQSNLQAQTQEKACRFDTKAYTKFYFGRRLVTSESHQSAQAAKEIAVKRMKLRADSVENKFDIYQCVGTPEIVCSDTNTFTLRNRKNLYRTQLGFICPNDEGYSAREKPKTWGPYRFRLYDYKYSGHLSSSSQGAAEWVKKDMESRFRTYTSENSEMLYRYPYNEFFQKTLKSCGITRWPNGFVPLLDVKIYRTNACDPHCYNEYVSGNCPHSKSGQPNTTTYQEPSLKPAKDSSDPRINWLTQHDFSNISYARAQSIAESKLVKRNLCRMRGGAVDFTYTKKYTEQYWVTIKYRCQYD